MIVTEEMVRGTHPNSPCRICAKHRLDCGFDNDEMASLNCIYMQRHLAEIEIRMKNSGARLWRLKTE